MTLGLAAGIQLCISASAVPWDWRPILLFGFLAIAATALSVSYQGFLPSTIVHQIGTSFVYTLLFLASPAAVWAVLCLTNAADWAVNRRRPFTAAFNFGQLSLSLWAAIRVREAIHPGFVVLDGVDARSMASAGAALLAFFVVNHALTHVVASLANRQPLTRLGRQLRIGFLNETYCIFTGLAMAVLWWVQPWLSLLGVLPLGLTLTLLILLSRRDRELDMRQAELRSLQEFGLEIGAELDAEKLRQAVVRVATEALRSSGALLAQLDERRKNLIVLSHQGLGVRPPESIPVQGLADEFFEAGAIRRIDDLASRGDEYGEIAYLANQGALLAPVRILGRSDGLLALFHDERRRPFDDEDVKRLETLVRFVDMALSNAQLVVDLKHVQAQLLQTEKMSALGMLVSGVAHELNNPLTSVVGYTQLLLDREADRERRRMLARVSAEAERAGRIVQNLLTFSRKHKSEKTLTDVNAVLDQVLDLRAYELRVNNIEIVRRLSPGLPPALLDRHQFQQVFLNLLTNAEYAVKNVARRGRISVETRRRGGWLRIAVSDNGHGIPAENLGKVFLPFFTTKEVGKGTGLGLSICYGIVQDHGGRIDVESRENEGATFVVEIPVAAEVDATLGQATGAEPRPPELPRAGHLLVVDDEEPIADLVRDVLEARGWRVSAAKDGAEALRMVSGNSFDVLLVDMKMPGMDGRAFFAALQESRPDLARRVVFSTGDAGGEGTSQFLDDAGNAVLGKPYDLNSLVETVSKVAENRASVS